MKFCKKINICFFAAFIVAGLSGCGSDENAAIKVGATVGPHAQVIEAVVIEAEKQGLKVELVEFSDFITPNAALADGSIDLNSYQHLPFLNYFNNSRGTELASLGQSILMRMGVYSSQHQSIEHLPEKAKIAIPNDPTNGGRGLLLLAKAGLITLKEGVGHKAVISDITSNPKKLEFIEIEAAQLPRSLDDVDAATITMNYVMSAGLSPKENGIFLESRDEPLAVMVIAAREQDKNKPEYKKFVEIYQSQVIKDYLSASFNGTIEPAF
ncbi:methionine ABC transporter substrate-binding protein [Endozoicomonas sp. OPT23]|uniref:MetQ/NlpA family ABC transporter substrate-binding protein n=1 Tax=Endozoicomonas sp. OPT23 TaxID=2072845 RepID=UPI00129A4C01|nr:MetQ/NlpA family ABC transporter substrate-binding protein [Endozoicomonas sp. OPT23]MRI31809.1 methionine ABC transporter substrate-binding protein [Endozoicomonas sp. OPT23]